MKMAFRSRGSIPVAADQTGGIRLEISGKVIVRDTLARQGEQSRQQNDSREMLHWKPSRKTSAQGPS
jgi:hypothetical protein